MSYLAEDNDGVELSEILKLISYLKEKQADHIMKVLIYKTLRAA